MISPQLKQKLTIVALVLVVIAIIWILIQLLLYSWSAFQNKEVSKVPEKQPTTYIEKIDNFVLQVFDDNQKLSYFVRAKRYLNFKDAPALLLEPKVVAYNKQGKKNYNLTAQRAYYLHNGNIKFQGKIDIRSHSGVVHKINTEALIVATNTHDLFSHKKVVYLGETAKIEALGMRLQSQNDTLLLSGNTKINQDSGQVILTKNLIVNQANEQKYYHSSHATQYWGKENTIYASNGIKFDAVKQVVQLLGKVNIVHNTESEIETSDLTIDQSNGVEVYQTEEAMHYQNSIVDIRAIGMYYDVKNQKIKLTGGVRVRYE